LGEGAAVEDLFAGGEEVGADAAEGGGEVVEGAHFGVGGAELAEEEVDGLAGVEAGGEDEAVAEAGEGGAAGFADILFAAEGEVFVVRFVEEEFVPVELVDGLPHFGGGHAGGVEAADEAAHAGAGDEVDGDAVTFEPFDDADVGQG
jgi:hypothetical protein